MIFKHIPTVSSSLFSIRSDFLHLNTGFQCIANEFRESIITEVLYFFFILPTLIFIVEVNISYNIS